MFGLAFIVVNQASQFFLGECIFTTIARFFYVRSSYVPPNINDWFIVRVSKTIFKISPTQLWITSATKILVGLFSVGGMYVLLDKRKKSR